MGITRLAMVISLEKYLWLNNVLARRTGFHLKRAQPSFSLARKYLFDTQRISKVYDCGANEGQWLREFRLSVSNEVPVVCFEPLASAVEKLEVNARDDQFVQIHQLALSNFEGRANLFVASNSGMSSSLRYPQDHLSHYGNVEFNDLQEVTVARLDSFLDPLERHYLKIDVQGGEYDLLQSATRTLDTTHVLEIELSLTGRMYAGEVNTVSILELLEKSGLSIFSLSDVARNRDGACLYIDALLVRR